MLCGSKTFSKNMYGIPVNENSFSLRLSQMIAHRHTLKLKPHKMRRQVFASIAVKTQLEIIVHTIIIHGGLQLLYYHNRCVRQRVITLRLVHCIVAYALGNLAGLQIGGVVTVSPWSVATRAPLTSAYLRPCSHAARRRGSNKPTP